METTTGAPVDAKKSAIVTALYEFIRQRSGIEAGNYDSAAACRAEAMDIRRDGSDARSMLWEVERCAGITGDSLQAAFSDAFSGRLSCEVREGEGVPVVTLDYCTGQYFPTEYRKAAASVCASALWAWRRNVEESAGMGVSGRGDRLRAHFLRLFGKRIAGRYFQ